MCLTDCVLLLLQEKYLQGRKERMQRVLQEASAVADAMASAAQAPARSSSRDLASDSPAVVPGVDDPASWGCGADGAVPSLSTFVRTLDERLINAMQETVMNMNTIFLQVWFVFLQWRSNGALVCIWREPQNLAYLQRGFAALLRVV